MFSKDAEVGKVGISISVEIPDDELQAKCGYSTPSQMAQISSVPFLLSATKQASAADR